MSEREQFKGEPIYGKGQAWYRLEPGDHVFRWRAEQDFSGVLSVENRP